MAEHFGTSAVWRERERAKFADGTYTELPWKGEDWWIGSDAARDHFAHVSEDDTSKLAYTPDERFGREDRQLRTRPGKYLNKFFSEILTPKEIAYWAGEFAGANERNAVSFATTPDEIEELYTTSGRDGGVSACMSYDASHFAGDCHPTRIYGSGELAIAYLGTVDSPTARVLVRLEPKVYGRIYGDSGRLRAELDRLQYLPDSGGDFNGSKLLRVECGEGFVGPYLDNGYAVSDHGDYLTMESCGEYAAQETNGTIAAGPKCDSCGNVADTDYCVTVGDDTWCESCYSEYGYSCYKCGETGHREYSHQVDGEDYCEYCADQISTVCDKCGDRVLDDNINTVSGEDWCDDCRDSWAQYCEHCEEYVDTRNVSVSDVEGEDWCEDCIGSDAVKCEDCAEHFHSENTEDCNGENRCEDCAESWREDQKDHDQLELFAEPMRAGVGIIWGTLWGDSVHSSATDGREVRSGAMELWGPSRPFDGEYTELLAAPHCVSGNCAEHTRHCAA